MLIAAPRCLRIPADRPAVVSSASVEVTSLDPWRRSALPGYATMDLRVCGRGSASSADRAPAELACQASIRIDGTPCGTAELSLDLPAGGTHPDDPAQTSGLIAARTARSAAIQAAVDRRGFATGHCVVNAWSFRSHGLASLDAPLSCATTPGEQTRDAAGRPIVPVEVEVTSLRRTIATASVSVLLDC